MIITKNNLSKSLFCASALGVVGYFDSQLGYEISVSPLYFLLIAYTAWQFDLMVGLLAALAATFCRSWSDHHSGLTYSSEWLRYENALMRLLVFGSTAYALTMYRRTLEAHRRRLEAMRRMLPICHHCGSVRDSDGHWHKFNELSHHPFPKIDECPDCEQKSEPPVGSAGRSS